MRYFQIYIPVRKLDPNQVVKDLAHLNQKEKIRIN